MVFLSSTGSFQKRPLEQPHVEEPAFGIALAEQTRDEAQEGRWFSPPHNGSVSKLAYAVVILTTRVLPPAPRGGLVCLNSSVRWAKWSPAGFQAAAACGSRVK